MILLQQIYQDLARMRAIPVEKKIAQELLCLASIQAIEHPLAVLHTKPTENKSFQSVAHCPPRSLDGGLWAEASMDSSYGAKMPMNSCLC